MQFLKQSTAATVKIGPFVDATDGFTVEAGLTISQADVRLSKNGGNIAQKGDATACTYDEVGMYDCPLSTTDTGTAGRLQLIVNESGARPVHHEFMVLPAIVYDSVVSGTDYLQVDMLQVEGNDAAGALFGHPTILNVVHTGDNAVSGATLKTVVELATEGTLVRVAAGIYDLDGDSIAVPAGVKVVGAGRGLTRIISDAVPNGTPVMTTGTRCELRDMTIDGLTDNEGVAGGVALSWIATAHVNFHGYNLELIGQNDSMIYVPTSGTRGELYFENCRFEARNEGNAGTTDNVIVAATTGTAVTVFRNCEVYTDGGTQSEATGIKGGGAGNNYVYFYGGSLECVNTTNDATCLRIDSGAGATEFYAFDTAIRSRSTNGTALDLNKVDTDTNTILGVSNCSFNKSKTSGLITELGSIETRLVNTKVSGVTSQTVLVLSEGPSVDDVLNGQTAIVYDNSANNAPSIRTITDYVGSTKTITLNSAPGFTVVVNDEVRILPTAGPINDVKTTIGTPAGASIAADIAAVDTAVDSVVGAAQSRINYPPSITLKVAARNDGTYTANKPVRLLAGTFDTDKAVGLDMSSYFGKNVQPASVGTPVVSSGGITCTALGPRDEIAMVQLGGTATAGETPTVTVPVTMDNGDQITVAFGIEVGSV